MTDQIQLSDLIDPRTRDLEDIEAEGSEENEEERVGLESERLGGVDEGVRPDVRVGAGRGIGARRQYALGNGARGGRCRW